MPESSTIETAALQRFARLVTAFLQGTAVHGLGPRAARDRPGPGLEFLDVRDYQQGDDIRHIDWRQSVRRQRPVVRRYRDEGAADWYLCLDNSPSVTLHEAKWQMQARLGSALAYALLYAGHRVSLMLFSESVDAWLPLGRGARQYAHLVSMLAQSTTVPAQERKRPGDGVRRCSNLGSCRDYLTQNASVFVISDFLEADGMQGDLRSIRAAASSADALQVLLQDEWRLPANGMVELRDAETGDRTSMLIDTEILENAGRAVEAHRQDLEKVCAALGIRFAACTTGDRWEHVLLAQFDPGT